MVDSFDLIVIGSGPGGYVAAIRAAQLGMKVAVVEKEHLGGICLNWGCIPTKALLRSSEINHLLNHANEFGFKVGNISFDIKKIVERSRNVSKQLANGIGHLLKKNKITHIEGFASFEDKNTINVNHNNKDIKYKAKNIIIATGARARTLDGMEPDGKFIWTYKEAMLPEELPKSLLVVGSGAIGVEFASFYKNLGVDVTLMEVQERILPVEDHEISELAHKIFSNNGIKVHTNTTVSKLIKNKGDVTVEYMHNSKKCNINVDKVIMAVGVVANTENLNLDKVGVKLDKGQIQINEYLQTNTPNIYAIGDVAGAPWLAHKASHEAIICVEKIAGKNPVPLKKENIPGCTYCMPQIASVGITEKQAQAKNLKVKIGRFPYMANGKAIAMGETEGLIKTIFDEKTGELLGAHMIGAEVTELIQGFVIGKTLEATEEELMHTIFPHPTLSEMMHESVLDAFGKVIHK